MAKRLPMKRKASRSSAKPPAGFEQEIAALRGKLDEARGHLAEAHEQQIATSEVLRVISSSPGELEPVFSAILANATRICGAPFATLFKTDGGDALRVVALHGPPEFVEERRRNPILHMHPGSGAFWRTRETRRAVQITDAHAEPVYLTDPTRRAFLDLAGVRTLLCVPMLKGDEMIGGIVVYRQAVQPFSEKQIALLETFASQAVIAIENARSLSELRESLEQQTATADVLKVLSRSAFDLQPVFNTLVESAVTLCHADRGTIRVLRDGAYHHVATFGFSPEHVEFMKAKPAPADSTSLAGRVALTGRPVHIIDVTDDAELTFPRTSPNMADVRTLLGIPLLREGRPIGLIVLTRNKVEPFTERQIELVTTFADQAVIAIENTRLLNELRERTDELSEALEQQTAVSEVLSVISSSPGELKPVFDAILQNATRICEAQFGNLFLREGNNVRTVAVIGVPSFADSWRQNPVMELVPNTPSHRVLGTGQIVQILDMREDEGYLAGNPRTRQLVEIGGARTFISFPMMKEDQAIGTIGMYRQEVRPFSDKQIELMRNFAKQAVIAIENVRLFDSVQARTRELMQSLQDLQVAQDRLIQTEKLASLGQLTAGIAHEIKNPLNFVNNFSAVSVELIDELRDAINGVRLDGKLRGEINELAEMLQGNLEKVVQHGKRADSIVKNMLSHSRQGSGEHRPVDINAILEESLNLAYHGARAEKQDFNINLERSFDPAAGEVDVFPQEITRVLLNLISNGFYAATKRKKTSGGDYEPILAAATQNLGDRVEIRIRDNGTGIPPEIKEKIFNPFFTTKPAGEGTGLGLSLSHDIIVKQHAGAIEVDTQPGDYTEFKIILPRGAATIAKSGG